MEILQQMLKRAQENPQRIVLPEGDEPRTLEAANILLKDKIADLILIGDPQKINKMHLLLQKKKKKVMIHITNQMRIY